MKKALLCLFFALGIGGLSAQPGTSVSVTAPCIGQNPFVFTYDAANSPDASGRNVFFYSNTSLEIRYNTGASRWEIRARGGNFDLYYVNSFASSPNPPDNTTFAWDDFGFCDNTGAPIVTGTGTQTTIGGDPCDGLGGDTDGDGVCDDNDICPGSDDFADMDSDGIPDGCDANPTVPDGVLVDADCLNPTPILFTLSGQDGTGRNIYSTPFANGLEVRYNDGSSRWEVRAAAGNMDVYFFNSFSTFPDPPNTATGTWEPGPSQLCTGAPEPDVSGSGTMDCVAPVITSVVADQPNYCPLDLVTLTITGDLNGAEEWVIYGNQGCGVNDITRVTDDDNDGVVVVPVGGLTNLGSFTFYVRGEGGCVANSESCTSVEVEIGGTPADVPALGLDQSSYCPNVENIELTITGNLNNADEWVIYNNDGCGVTEVGRVTDDDEDGIVVVNLGASTQLGLVSLFVRGEGACVADPGACAEIVANIGGTPADVPALGLDQSSYCPNVENIELTITGDLNNADEWVIYNNDGCGVTEVGRVTDDDEDGIVVVNLGASTQLGPISLFVRGEGACVADPGACAEIVANIGGTPADVPALGLDQSSYCANVENIELTITGNLNNADEWVIYNNDGCGVTEVGRVTDDDEDGIVVVNLGASTQLGPISLFVRGEGACVADPGACAEVVINVSGSELIVPTPPADMNLSCAAVVPPPVDLTFINECDEAVVVSPAAVITPGSCLNDFTIVRTWTVQNQQGDPISVSQTISVLDTLAPVIQGLIPADLNLDCASDVPPPVDLTAVDNCDGEITASPSTQITPGVCLNDFIMVRTWTFADICGNSSSVSQTITVVDTLAPVITSSIPADLDLECSSDIPPPVQLTAVDNCSGEITVSPSTQITPGVCLNDFIMVRTWTFADICGNSSSVSQTITVVDTLAPVITSSIPADLDLECSSDIPPPVQLTAVDNCSGEITVSPSTQITPGVCLNDFIMVRTWTFRDTCGNSSSVSQVITVLDTLAPVITSPIPASIDVQCASEVPPPVDLTAVDNCDGEKTVSPTAQITPSGNGNDFTMVRTWTFTDTCGNSSSVSQVIQVEDDTAPLAVCMDATVQLGEDGNGVLLVSQIDNNSTDNCAISDYALSRSTFDCTDVSPQIVTLTVTDVAGNEDECTASVTILGIAMIDEVIATDESCDGAGDGQLVINASGTGTLEYSIDGGNTFQDENIFTALADGSYEIVVQDKDYPNCEAIETGVVAAGPICELTATDPCSCLNNASPYDMDTETGGGDGQFGEVVTISAEGPLPTGLIFKVIAPTTGVYDVYNVPAEGTQSAGIPVATDGSVTFTYNDGIYELPFVHNDSEGYTMTVILEVEGVNSIGFQLSNTCFYPEPEITSVLDGPFCSLSLPITLEGNAGGVEGTGTFYIDGTEITVFNPALYEPGTYTISYEFDAGEALGYQIENTIVVGPPDGAESLEAAEADPGCIATVVKSIEVIPTPEGYACREQVNVNLQENCQATLSPESLVGNLECVDLSGYFEINVEDGDESNGATVDGCGNYRYTITGPDGFDCWGFVKAEDKQAPTLDYCPPTIEGITKNYGFQPFICDDITKLLLPAPITYTSDKDGNIYYDDIPLGVKDILDITGYATFVDNCGDLTITVSDDVAYGYDPDCDDVKIIRTFTAVDGCQGLAATAVCTQEIIFTKPDLEDVYCPEDVELDCADDFKLDAKGNPHPDETGYPWVYTAFDLTDDEIENYKSYLDQSFCNVGASYTDGARIEVCAGTYKVVRTWEILDWCSKETVTCQQIIKVGDDEPPVVSCPEVDYDNDGEADLLSFSTGPYDCTAAFSVPMPEVTDNCSEWEVLTEIIGFSSDGPVVATILPGQSRFVSGIPVGCHFIRYTVTDGCEQQEVLECPFVVEDRVEPTAVCNDDLNVSIGGQGLARVYADDINEGSSDNCGPIRIEVRRRITLGADYECLDMFDYDGDGEVIGDEVRLSTQFGDPDGTGNGQQFYYTAWGNFVDFNCCDMDQDVRIELRVWDDRNGDGLPGNEIEKVFCNDKVREIKDNYNVCWMDLLIEDKLPAYCIPPLPASIDCDALPFDFDPTNVDQMNDLFGEATGTDNCPVYTVSELAPMTDGLNDCGYGTLVRRFQVADAKGQVSTNNCEQLITIKERHHYKIKFPKDAEAICGTAQPDTIEVEELACDLLAVSVKEDFFSASGDECYKIFRTYSVINWCEYDGQSDPVVVSRDEDCDGQPGDEDIWVIVETMDDPDPCYDYYGTEQADYYSHVWYDRDNDPFNLLPKAGTKGKNCDYETNPFGFWKEVSPITENQEKDTDAYPEGYDGNHCDDMASTGYWQYTQIIKVYDNVNPVVSFTAPDPFCSYSSDFDNDCPAEVSISFTIDENCTPDDLTINLFLDQFADGTLDGEITNLLSGTYPNYTISGSFPLGAHAIGVSVEDGCGKQVGVNIPFEVVDCKAPAPACINGLAIELMPVIPAADVDDDGDIDNGAMAIWASDFIASPLTDCSPEVTYSINRIGEEVDRDQTGLTLTCDDDASLLVEIWAWDAAGNGDFCETYVLVQDNMVNCEGNASGSIAGMITDEDLRPMDGVEMALSGSEILNMITEEDGNYAFDDLAIGFDYTVTPHLDKRPLNGVSTFDLVLMSKHILGVQLLDSPYKMIAADVNNSKTITTLDAIQLRRLVLNIDTKFGNNNSWRFIPRDYRFPDPAAPWTPAFPEVININNLQGELTQEDFIGVKIGDLNLSAATSAFEFEARNTVGNFLLEVNDQALRVGETYRVEFRAKDLARIQGYQLTLQVDPEAVRVAELNYGLAKVANFGTRMVKEGFITTSWNVPVDGSARYSSEEVLFSLDLEATADVQLSDILRVSNRITVAEAYDLGDQLLDVGIDFGTGTVATSGFELYQNVPNPFRESTNIGFYLPEASEVSLRISDVSGRTIKLIRANFDRGQHQVLLTRNELGAAGILYYTLTAGEHSATRKLIVIE